MGVSFVADHGDGFDEPPRLIEEPAGEPGHLVRVGEVMPVPMFGSNAVVDDSQGFPCFWSDRRSRTGHEHKVIELENRAVLRTDTGPLVGTDKDRFNKSLTVATVALVLEPFVARSTVKGGAVGQVKSVADPP